MVLSRSDRCRMVVKWLSEQKKMPMSKVGELIGYNNASSFSQVLNDKRDVPSTFPARIASLDPRINIDFLTGESDEMLLPGNIQPGTDELAKRQSKARESGVYMPPELLQMFADLSSTVRDQQHLISTLINNITKQ